jgi:hypothetical protein
MLFTDINARGIVVVLPQVESINTPYAPVNQGIAQRLRFPVIPAFDKQREAGIRLDLNTELDAWRVVFIFLPKYILLDALCIVGQQRLKLGLGHDALVSIQRHSLIDFHLPQQHPPAGDPASLLPFRLVSANSSQT